MAPTAREIREAEELLYLEYWCKLTFRSTDLHVKRGWSLAAAADLERFKVYAEKLQGPIVYSLIDVEDILGEEAALDSQTWPELIDAGRLDGDWKHFEFPVGSLEAPRRSQRKGRGEAKAFLMCKVALGRASVVKDGPPKFPEFFSSCLVRDQASTLAARGADVDPVADWQQVYRVRSGDQVLPFALCEVVFEEQRAAAKALICEYCEQRPASVYCKNDNAHFCAACDATHHSENEFFARHQRFSLEHSPLQFGFCRQHPSERHESVCLQCKTMLCRMCNKFGDHARKEHEGHTLMSTVEAFQQAMQGSTDSDQRKEKHLTSLRDALQDRHIQLTEVHHNFQETQHQMDGVLRGALDQLERAQSRKLEFLQSMKRQVTTQLLFIQWLDNFQAHARMALPPAEFVVATKRHEGLLAALFGSSQGAIPKGAELGLGAIPAWVNEELMLEGAVAVQLASLPPPIAEPGPAAPKPAAELTPRLELQLSNGKANEDPGSSYLEATPRGGAKGRKPKAEVAGIAGVSDTLYAQPVQPALEASRPDAPLRALPAPAPAPAPAQGLLDKAAVAAVEQVPNQNARAEFDGYISQAFAYLDEAQKRMEARMGVLPSVSAAVPPRVASLQLATEVLVQLRQSAEQLGGAAKPWGALLMLLSSCPGGERQELLLKALRVAAPMGDTAGQLARAVVEDDVQRTQVPSLLVSANGLHSALTQALQRLSAASFMEREITILIREVEVSPSGAAGNSVMHLAVENCIKSMVHSLRSGQGHVHPSLTSLCHLVYSSAEVKFGILAAQNAVLTLLLSRVVTPSILRAKAAAGVPPGTPLPERSAELSRLLQRIAHFAHHEDQSSRGEASVPDLPQVLKHVSSLRELVARVLALPPDAQMGLNGSPEDSEAAALWIVETCRRWSAGVPSVPSLDTAASPVGDPPGRARQQQQLQLAAGAFARLGDPAHAQQAMPQPPRGL